MEEREMPVQPAEQTKNELTQFHLDQFDKTLVFPFYINKIEHMFFPENLVLHQHKSLLHDPHKEFGKKISGVFAGYQNPLGMSNEERIQIVLNKVFNQFSYLTGKKGNSFFKVLSDNGSEKQYVSLDESYTLRKEILGNYHDDKRYAFKVEINSDSMMARLAKKLNFCFYIDHTKKKMLGAFSYDSADRVDHNLSDAVDDFYFSNFVFQFVKEQFFPLCLDNILNLFRDKDGYDTHDQEIIRMENAVDFKKVSLEQLENHWQENIEKKFLFFKKDLTPEERDYYKYELFYELMTIILLMVFGVEEVKNLFTMDNLSEVKSVLTLPADRPNINQEIKQDFVDFARYLDNLHRANYKPRKRSFDEMIRLSHLDRDFDYYYFCDPVIINNFTFNYLVNPSKLRQFLVDNRDFFNYLFLTMYPEFFRLGDINLGNFEPLPSVKLNFLKLYQINCDKYIDMMIDNVCENDLYVHSFIRKANVAIFKCYHKDTMAMKKPYQGYYYWAEIFMQTRMYELQFASQVKAIIRGSKVHWKNIMYRKTLRDLHDMYYDEQSHFFGLGNIASIVDKISTENKFTDRYTEINAAVQFEDELWKRGTERSNFMMAFLVAIFVGGLNYLSMIFSATSDSTIVGNGWPGVDVGFPWVYTSIACGALIEITNMGILTFAVFRVLYINKKFKEIDNHSFEK